MYYGSGTGGRYCICAEQTLCMHSLGGRDEVLGRGRPNKKKYNSALEVFS